MEAKEIIIIEGSVNNQEIQQILQRHLCEKFQVSTMKLDFDEKFNCTFSGKKEKNKTGINLISSQYAFLSDYAKDFRIDLTIEKFFKDFDDCRKARKISGQLRFFSIQCVLRLFLKPNEKLDELTKRLTVKDLLEIDIHKYGRKAKSYGETSHANVLEVFTVLGLKKDSYPLLKDWEN